MNKHLLPLASESSNGITRRHFLKRSSLAAATAAAAVSFPNVLRAQNKLTLNAVIIGVGGRGVGAGKNFLEAAKQTGVDGKIVAVADIFPEQSVKSQKDFGVPAERAFSGFDAYRKALEVPGVNYAILAAPPGFRPSHFKACVAAGKHIFTEKPVAVDGPGCAVMYAAGEEAKKKDLKVVAGTQRRHSAAYNETIKRIQGGEIGDVVSLRAYWVNASPIWHRGVKGDTDLEVQIRNWYHYIWLCGDHHVEQHIHNIDVCNWIMGTHPVKAWGMGARQVLGDAPGEIWDNFAVEYEYANGVRMHSYCGQIKREWHSVSEAVHGAKGTSNPSGAIQVKGGEDWRFAGKGIDPYVQEHIDLINAIANDKDVNETKQVTDTTLTAIMGREAAYSGQLVDWDSMANSKYKYGPDPMYGESAQMAWGPHRKLKPPIPNQHDVFAETPIVPVA